MFKKNFNLDFGYQPRNKYSILWDQIELNPVVQIKVGIFRRNYPLKKTETNERRKIYYQNEYVKLEGIWENLPHFCSKLSFKLTNVYRNSIRLARLVFPTENGLDDFIKNYNKNNISFLRNGYQSWSTTRSYRIKDIPVKPWLELVSLASSNMANLPSNRSGIYSSDMFSVISDLYNRESFLVGQASGFNQFFYIKLVLNDKTKKFNHFELVFDFGRKMLLPKESINMDDVIMAKGDEIVVQEKYFNFLNKNNKIEIKDKIKSGWCSWYYYYNKVTFENIINNAKIISDNKIKIDFIQIDDGYQKYVGDWLDLTPSFNGKMKELATTIKALGFVPGIWIAPFIADKKSSLVKNFPDYVLKDEYGKPIFGGYNPVWPGKFYYGLDITNPRFEEYLRNIFKIIVYEWGFELIKLDFLYGGSLRGGNHYNFKLSRSEILKYGMKIIREEVGNEVTIIGCGMPLSCGINQVDIMRIGPDTADYWRKIIGNFLRTGSMMGKRNAIRNTIVRSLMNKNLWINDPDCITIKGNKNNINQREKNTFINTVIVSGGLLTFSDNFQNLKDDNFFEIEKIRELHNQCFKGKSFPLDVMEREIPEIYFNTNGFICLYNFSNRTEDKIFDFKKYNSIKISINFLKDVWSDHIFEVKNNVLILKNMEPHSSRLFLVV